MKLMGSISTVYEKVFSYFLIYLFIVTKMNISQKFLSLDPCFVLQKNANSDTYGCPWAPALFHSHSEPLAENFASLIDAVLEIGSTRIWSSRPKSTRSGQLGLCNLLLLAHVKC